MHCVSWAVKQVCLLLFGTVGGWWLCSHSPEMPSCFWHPKAQQVAASTLHPGFLLLSLQPLYQHIFDNVLNGRNTHRTSPLLLKSTDVKISQNLSKRLIKYDWWLVWIEWAATGCTSQGTTWLCGSSMCSTREWPETDPCHAMAGFRHGMLTSPPGSLCGGCAGAEGQSPARED